MPTEQLNISLPPKMARFIRSKVKAGNYTDVSEVVRDAVRHMQEAEAFKKERVLLASFEDGLSASERDGIRRGVKQGIRDIESGHYEEYDAAGLRGLAKTMIAASAKKHSDQTKP